MGHIVLDIKNKDYAADVTKSDVPKWIYSCRQRCVRLF
jgi:hypothetical protein